MVHRDQHRVAAVEQGDAHVRPRRGQVRHGALELPAHLLVALPRHQPQADLGHGMRGYHGLGAVAHEAAANAVDLEGGERPGPLQDRIVPEPGERRALDLVPQEGLLVEGELAPALELLPRGWLDRLVHLGDPDLPLGALEAAEDPHQRLQRIGGDPAVGAGMQVALKRADRDLRVAESPERRVHGGQAGGEERAVADQDGVGAGPLGLGAEQIEDHPAATLLLALEDEAHVERRAAIVIQDGLVRLQEAEDLPLVVGRPAGVQSAVAHRRGEGRGFPLLQGIGGLDVVVTIDQERGPARYGRALGPDHRMAVALDQVHHRAAQAGQLGTEPLGGTAGVLGVVGERAHARDREKVGELLEESRLLAVDECGVHATRPGSGGGLARRQENYTSVNRGREGWGVSYLTAMTPPESVACGLAFESYRRRQRGACT